MIQLSLLQSTAADMRLPLSCHMFLGSKCGIFLSIQGMSSMVEAWISQANARQRSGRAGRVRSGNCFCLYTRNRLEKLMRPFQVIYFPPSKYDVYLAMIKLQMNCITMWFLLSDCFSQMFSCCTLLLKTLVTWCKRTMLFMMLTHMVACSCQKCCGSH